MPLPVAHEADAERSLAVDHQDPSLTVQLQRPQDRLVVLEGGHGQAWTEEAIGLAEAAELRSPTSLKAAIVPAGNRAP